MAASKAQSAELRKQLDQAKQQVMNFAFCPGKGDPGVLLLDRRKPAESLVRDARKASSGTKCASGRFSVQGSTAIIDCDEDLPNLPKIMRDFLSAMGRPMKVELATAPGAAPQDDTGQADAAPAPADPQTPPPDAPQPDAAPAAPEPPPEPAADGAALERAGKLWTAARRAALRDLQALVAAIATQTRGIDGLADAGKRAQRLARHFRALDGRLSDALDRLSAADDAARDRLARDARALIAEYRAVMDTDFFRAVDQSGFARTNIRDTMLKTLKQVESALA